MTPIFKSIFCAASLALVTACAQSDAKQAADAISTAPSTPSVVSVPGINLPIDDVNWIDEPWGGKTALIWGDPMTGPSGFYIYHPAGYKMPADVTIAHSANMIAVILTGWMKVWEKGTDAADAPKLPAGSFFLKSGGVDYHELHSPEEETIVYVTYDLPRDTFLNGKLMGPPPQ